MIKNLARKVLAFDIGMYEKRIELLKDSLADQRLLVANGLEREEKLRSKVWELRHVIEG